MFRFSWFTAFSVAFIFVLPLSVEAQRRGGGRSGGGISRSATQARPSSSSQFRGQSMSSQRSVTQNSSSINRSSGSINRSSGSINRSSGSINRSSGSINVALVRSIVVLATLTPQIEATLIEETPHKNHRVANLIAF